VLAARGAKRRVPRGLNENGVLRTRATVRTHQPCATAGVHSHRATLPPPYLRNAANGRTAGERCAEHALLQAKRLIVFARFLRGIRSAHPSALRSTARSFAPGAFARSKAKKTTLKNAASQTCRKTRLRAHGAAWRRGARASSVLRRIFCKKTGGAAPASGSRLSGRLGAERAAPQNA